MFTLSIGLKGAIYLTNVANMPYLDQSSTNGCGTTSLAMVMTYLGVPKTQEQIDSSIRRMDVFSSPEDLIDYARDNGLTAQGYNNGEWGQVQAHIEQGHPCICLIYADYVYPSPLSGRLKGLHYVAINGYVENPAAGESFAILHDPNKGADPMTGFHGIDMEAPIDDFSEMWDSVGWGPFQFHSYYIAFGSKGTELPLGNDKGVEGMLGTLDGVMNLTNGLNRLYAPRNFGDWIHGLFQFFGGIAQTVVSGIGALLQIAGQKLNGLVDGVPVLRNIVQPIGDAIYGTGATLGDLGNGVGDVLDDIGDALGDLFSGNVSVCVEEVGEVIEDAAEAVGDAVEDAASAASDAVRDFFSGW